MIVRKLKDCEASDRRVKSDNWESTRMLLKDDNMGFSFHITTIYAGTTTLSSKLKPVDLPESLSTWNHGGGSNQAAQ